MWWLSLTATCNDGTFHSATGANTPLVHKVISPVDLQLVLVVILLPTTGTNTLLALE